MYKTIIVLVLIIIAQFMLFIKLLRTHNRVVADWRLTNKVNNELKERNKILRKQKSTLRKDIDILLSKEKENDF